MMMPSSYNCSIFAHQLQSVLANHSRTIEDLQRRPINLDFRTVKALHESLTSIEHLPGLNLGDIMTISVALRLSTDERFAIYAALLALGVQRQMRNYFADKLDGLAYQRLWNLAVEVQQLALVWLKHQKYLNL